MARDGRDARAAARDLQALGDDARGAAQDVLEEGAERIAAGAGQLAPRGTRRRARRRGRAPLPLADSIRVRPTRRGAQVLSRKPYANRIEEGDPPGARPQITGRHFLRRAAEAEDAQIERALDDRLERLAHRRGLPLS